MITKSTYINMKKRLNIQTIILINDDLVNQFINIENYILEK